MSKKIQYTTISAPPNLNNSSCVGAQQGFVHVNRWFQVDIQDCVEEQSWRIDMPQLQALLQSYAN